MDGAHAEWILWASATSGFKAIAAKLLVVAICLCLCIWLGPGGAKLCGRFALLLFSTEVAEDTLRIDELPLGCGPLVPQDFAVYIEDILGILAGIEGLLREGYGERRSGAHHDDESVD